ncbi:MAG: GAF domain-containing protein [Chloroflexi bacterium]|nr:GAF domain-containing protein [Chloroflexota bacterium]
MSELAEKRRYGWRDTVIAIAGELPAFSQQLSDGSVTLNRIVAPADQARDLGSDTTASLKIALDAILSSTRQLVPYDIAEITLWDEEQQCCMTQGWGGDRAYVKEAGGIYHIDEGYTGWIIHHRRFLLVRDVQARHDVRPRLDTSDFPFQSYIGIPLQTRHRFIGTLELASYQKDAWLERDLVVLQAISNQAVVAIENVHLYAETQRRAEQQAGLARIAALASSTLDLDELLNRVMDETLGLLEAERGVLLLYDEEQDALVARYLTSARADHAVVETFHIPTSADGFEQSIFVRGGSYFCNDPIHDPNIIPAYRPYMNAIGVRNFAGVALRLKERSIGELYLGDRKGGFGSEEGQILQTVAGYFASAIENARLYDEMRRRASELTSLTEISATVSESLELEHALQAIVSAVQKVVRCQRSAIFVLDEAQQVLRLAMTQGLSEEYVAQSQELTLERGGRAHAVATEEPLIISDMQADESLLAFAPMSIREGFRAFADLPLKRADRVIGMLSAMFVDPHRFSDIEIELLTAFADQAAIATENARLYTQADEELRLREEALRRRNRELSTLYEAATATSFSLSLSDVLQTVAEQMIRLLNSKGCTLSLWDRERNVVETLVDYNTTWAEQSGTTYALDKYPATRRVLETRQPVVIQRDDLTADRAELALMEKQGIQTLLMLPLITHDQVLGLAKLIDDNRTRDYTLEEIRLAESLAAQAAAAIENARLYEQAQQEIAVRRRAEDALRRLQRISREINTTFELEHILPLVLEEASRLGKATHGAIILRNSVSDELQLEVCTGYSTVEEARIHTLLQAPQTHPSLAKVLSSRESLLVSNVIAEIDTVGISSDTHSLLIVPIIYQESLAGMIILESIQREAFDRAALEFVEGLSAQATTAINNIQRYYDQLERGELLRRRADQLAAVLDVSHALRSDRPLEGILEEIAYAIQESVGFNLVVIGVVEGDPPHRRRVAAAGVPLVEFERMKKIQEPWHVVADLMITDFRVNRSYYIPAEEQDRWRGRLNVYEEYAEGVLREPGRWHPHDLLLVPLVGAGGDIQGVLSVDQPLNGRAPDWETVEALEIFAAQAALAIENARLFDKVSSFSQEMEKLVEERTQELAEAMEKLTEERDRVETLYRITSRLSVSLDLDYVLNLALRLVVDAVGAKQASILMIEPGSNILINRAAIGRKQKLPVGGVPTRFSSGEGLAGWVVENRKAVIIPDIQQDPHWIESSDKRERKYRSALAVPLMVGDDVMGVLLLFHAQIGHFDEPHLLLVETAVIQVVNAIRNAELYKLIFDQAEKLGNTLKAQKVEATKSQAILEGVADGVIVVDADSNVILFNAAAERILGLSREKALGRSINEMLGLYGSQARDWMEKISSWAEHPEMYTTEEYLGARLEIGGRVVSVLLAPVMMESEFLGAVSAFRDITAEVEAERAKTEFVSTVSHELRTPMTSIKGYVELLLMGVVGSLTKDQHKFLSVIDVNVERLTTLVNDLLDISRIESGRVALSPQIVHVEHIIEQVVLTMQARAMDQGLTLRSDLPPALPEILADPDRVTQILTNLVGNACNYTPTGGKVTVSVCAHDDKVCISVHDTGIGISEEDQEKIFERFFRADDSMVQDAPGTGLGLAIVRSLAEMQGGQVWVESELGKGSTFTFTLPTAIARQVPEEDAAFA